MSSLKILPYSAERSLSEWLALSASELCSALDKAALSETRKMAIYWVKVLDGLFTAYGNRNYSDACSLGTHSVQAGKLAQELMIDDKSLPPTFDLELFLHDVGDFFRPPIESVVRDTPAYGHGHLGAFITQAKVAGSVGLTAKHGDSKRFLIAYSSQKPKDKAC